MNDDPVEKIEVKTMPLTKEGKAGIKSRFMLMIYGDLPAFDKPPRSSSASEGQLIETAKADPM
jgi:hypothetical protein